MKALAIAAVAATLGVGCAHVAPDNSADVREVRFACVDGETLLVRFLSAASVAVLVRNAEAIELQQQPSGSGFIYSNGPNTIRGKGNDLIVEIGRMAPIRCEAR